MTEKEITEKDSTPTRERKQWWSKKHRKGTLRLFFIAHLFWYNFLKRQNCCIYSRQTLYEGFWGLIKFLTLVSQWATTVNINHVTWWGTSHSSIVERNVCLKIQELNTLLSMSPLPAFLHLLLPFLFQFPGSLCNFVTALTTWSRLLSLTLSCSFIFCLVPSYNCSKGESLWIQKE